MRLRVLPALALLALLLPAVSRAAVTFEREFRIDASRVRTQAGPDGATLVFARGGMGEFSPGAPDLPWIAEAVDVPAGFRVAGVEVLSAEWQALASGVRVAPAIEPTPGLDEVRRTAPDARLYASADFVPTAPVRVGEQGSMRGRNLAYLRLAAARWQPASGQLQRLASVRVRVTLEPALRTDVAPRERIVPEWEDALPGGAPLRVPGALTTSLGSTGREATPFRPQQLPSVLGSPVAYLIITTDAFAASFQALADWKTQSGLPATVRTLSFIQQQYPGASDDAERVRMFIRDAYSRWGTKWVLLGGDTDFIPERLARTSFYGGENIASDMYYSCLDGNWNADGDSLYGEGFYSSADPGDNVDLLPEVYVGRAPVNTLAEVQTFVTKTLQYEKTPLGNYEQRNLFFAEVLFPQNWTPSQITTLDGAELIEEILPAFDAHPELLYRRLYENYQDSRWVPGALQETRQAVLDSLNNGFNVAVHVGHGYRNVMSVGDNSLTNADALGLTNGNRLTNLYAINCTSNAIDFPCIGEAFLHNPSGGAVTNVGSTRFDFPTAGRAYQTEYFRLLLEDGVTAVGELQARQKLPFVAYSTYDGVNRWTQFTLLMLGDPELRIWRGQPKSLVVSHAATRALSDTTFQVTVSQNATPLAGARVTLYKSGDEFQSGLTDGAGQVTLPFRPDSLGAFSVTVTALDSRPYVGSVTLTGVAAPVLADGTPTIDDDSVGGTVGNANGVVDAGETIDLRVPVRNAGGVGATNVNATLATANPLVTISAPTVVYGAIGSGATVTSSAAFRVSFPYTMADQTEVPFTLFVTDGAGHDALESLALTVRAPELAHFEHGETETGGNNNGRPEIGETVTYTVKLRNNGTGLAEQVTAKLRSYDGLSVVTDSVATFGSIASGATVTGDGVTFTPSSASAKLALVVSGRYGDLWTQTIDLTYPAAPTQVLGIGAATSISLTWARVMVTDLRGYNVYRSLTSNGTFTRVNPVPTERVAYYMDEALSPLTRYYYKVTAVDSSGNESSQSAVANASTNPPSHAIYPIPLGRNTPGSVALEYIYQSSMMDIVAGADYLYLFHANGQAPVDADGSGSTAGDFTNRGSYYAAGPSVANLDGTGWSIIGTSWDSTSVYVFDKDGHVRPGWPLVLNDGIWGCAAVGDLDNDGTQELAFGSLNNRFYVMRANGSEWIDGDANATTKGVFKLLNRPYNFGTPAIADLDGNGVRDVVFGSYDGNMYAWRPDGSNLPGFPFAVPYPVGNEPWPITCSPAVGYLDGPGDTTPEIVFSAANESLYVVEPDGKRRAGWPIWIRTSGNSKMSSPALADMNNDGFLDIVFQSSNGGLYVFNRSGGVLFGLANLRYSTLTTGATESSPVVADINGDGFNDVVCGDETGTLSAFSGANGAMLPGFPIRLQGEVRGTPAVADIDRDGKTEIVLSGWDKNLYVWDYDFPFQPNGTAPWPQFHHDARRTGFYDAPLFVGVDDDPSAGGRTPQAVAFEAPQPNPANGRTRLWYSIPGDLAGGTYTLSIYDLSGRLVKHVDTGLAKAGRFSAAWDLRGEDGRAVEGGVYFARFSLGGTSLARKLVVLR